MSQPTCQGQTKRGASCRAPALPGRDRCIMHAPEFADKVAAARRLGGSAAARVRALQGKRQRLDSAPALVKFVSGVMQDCLTGTIDPKVANAVINAVNAQRALLETSSLEQRLAVLEARAQQPTHGRAAWGR